MTERQHARSTDRTIPTYGVVPRLNDSGRAAGEASGCITDHFRLRTMWESGCSFQSDIGRHCRWHCAKYHSYFNVSRHDLHTQRLGNIRRALDMILHIRTTLHTSHDSLTSTLNRTQWRKPANYDPSHQPPYEQRSSTAKPPQISPLPYLSEPANSTTRDGATT